MGAILSSLFISIPQSPCCVTKYRRVPPPRCIHMTLSEEQIQNRTLIVVGDVHGCLEELEELIRLTQVKYGDDCLYLFVGDIINKGPKSVETLHFVQHLKAYVVRGNNEERIIKMWIDFKSGRLKALSKKYSWMHKLSEYDMNYIMELPYTISIPSRSMIIVHAGLSAWKNINKQNPRHMVTMRNIVGIDKIDPRESEHVEKGVPWASVWPGPQHVYFGHDAKRRLQIYPHATGLDTGCVYGGSLTAVNASLPGTVIISVPARFVYKEEQ